jgi:hypothetical protein
MGVICRRSSFQTKKERLPWWIITDLSLFSITFPKYLKLSHMSMSHTILSPNSILVSTYSSNLNLYLQILLPNFTSWLHLVHPQLREYFDFSNTFDLVPYAILLRKLNYFGLYPTDVTRFHSYLTNRISPSSLSWRTSRTLWIGIRCATRINSGSTSFQCFHKGFD